MSHRPLAPSTDSGPASAAEVLALPPARRDPYLDRLVPDPIRTQYDLPSSGVWQETTGVWRLRPGARSGSVRIEVWPDAEGEDPALVLELTDTHLGKLELVWVSLNDLRGPRYGVDRNARGEPIQLESRDRNLAEERRALADGLAPNQVRPGLRGLRALLRGVDAFARDIGVDLLYVVPLAYHNAIQYERHGFTYASDDDEMAALHGAFLIGGALRPRLDGSTPFRMPAAADTVRGRSWAIHDGILGHRWQAPQMYKFTDRDFHTCSFPDAAW